MPRSRAATGRPLARRSPPRSRPRSRRRLGGAGLGGLVAGRRGAHAACPRGRVPRLPRRGRRRRRRPRRCLARHRLPRVPRRGRGRARLARARAPAARPRCPSRADHGWLALNEGSLRAERRRRPRACRRPARFAARLGRELASADLEAVGLALDGIAEVIGGRVPRACGCSTRRRRSPRWRSCGCRSRGLGALLPDRRLRRRGRLPARDAVVHGGARGGRALGRAPAGRGLPQHLRPRAGHERRLGGAEGELVAVVGDLEARPGQASGGLARLGELRARQGRTDEARTLFKRAAPTCVLGLGELALRRPTPPMRPTPPSASCAGCPPPTCSAACPRSSCWCARGRSWASSTRPARRTPRTSSTPRGELGTSYLLGRARLAAGVAFARGRPRRGPPRERGRGRPLVDRRPVRRRRRPARLARALLGLGRTQSAAAVASAAGTRSPRSARCASSPPPRPCSPATSRPAEGLGELSARELEILRLVAQGLGDAEIAERLVLSPHTVHRHVANVRTKLRLPSRTAAVAYAARAGLL